MNDMEFSEGVETVLRDLRAQCAVQPDIRWDDAGGITLWAPDGSGHGLTPHPDGTAAELLVHLADQVQDWAVETLWSEGASAVWPQCPTHPDTHPLTATLRTDAAVWVCPKRGTSVARIGELKTH